MSKEKFGNLINDIIYYTIRTLGFMLSAPVFIVNRFFKIITIKKNDIFDRWTFAHVFASAYLFFIFYVYGINMFNCLIYSFGIMYLYELFIDGFKLSDPEGFSVMDIGADALGSFLFYVILLIKNGG